MLNSRTRGLCTQAIGRHMDDGLVLQVIEHLALVQALGTEEFQELTNASLAFVNATLCDFDACRCRRTASATSSHCQRSR